MIRKGILLPDSQPVGVGINDARRGTADIGSEQIAVIFKRLPELELAAELFCAVLARELALPAPEPLLLFDPARGMYLFGSVDLEYPNSLRSFNIDPLSPDQSALDLLLAAVRAWPRVKEVTAFDEWIHNRDRNLGNLLFVGADEFSIIDHGRALDIDIPHNSRNILCDILRDGCGDDKAQRALLKSLQRTAASFDMLHAESPRVSVESNGILSHTGSANTFYNLVEDRLANLVALLQNRFSGQQGLTMADSTI